jgi:hypothetical protein
MVKNNLNIGENKISPQNFKNDKERLRKKSPKGKVKNYSR